MLSFDLVDFSLSKKLLVIPFICLVRQFINLKINLISLILVHHNLADEVSDRADKLLKNAEAHYQYPAF